MLRKVIITAATIASLSGVANAADQIRAAGSSTVYPFVTVAAETFGRKGEFKTPIVESTGTGGGFKLFCAGNGEDTTDLSNASRAIKDSEKALCASTGVTEITELKIGYDGIVVANAVGAKKYTFTKKDFFLGIEKQVPQGGKLVDNPNKTWKDVNSALPETKIEVYGPPPTSGTRDAFVELVMDKVCEELPEFQAAHQDKKAREKACITLREDGAYIDSGENDNLIIQKLRNNPDALGIFGFSFLDQNQANVQGSIVESVDPTFENISSGSYPLSRPLFVYLKNSHLKTTKGLKQFVMELTSDNAIGEEGYLVEKGLIPLPADQLAATQAKLK